MHILISGSSGLVGSALRPFLAKNGHRLTRLVRHVPREENQIRWFPDRGVLAENLLEGVEGVCHLSGESIAEGRWTPEKKQRILDSRVDSTTLLSQTIAKLDPLPKVFVSASAIGFYGDCGDEVLNESSSPGDDFLAEVCQKWEAATQPARDAGIRVVNLRIGLVLSKEGGALRKMLLPFKLGGGGVVGNGRQYWSWIGLSDLVSILHHCLVTESLEGPVNGVAPNAVTNREFTKALGSVLRRPTIVPLPAFAARLVLGEMANALLLSSARAQPAKLEASGFTFGHPQLEGALRAALDQA